MKKILLVSILFSFGVSAQESKIDSLENEIKKIDEQISDLSKLKNKLNSEILIERQKAVQFEEENGVEGIVGTYGAALWTLPDLQKAESIIRLKTGEKVQIFEATGRFLRVKYNDINAYVLSNSLVQNSTTSQVTQKYIREARLNELNERFGVRNGRRILNKQVWVGMTKEMAIASIGSPSEKTRTRFEWGTSETWFYKRGYSIYRTLHFDGNLLKIISDY